MTQSALIVPGSPGSVQNPKLYHLKPSRGRLEAFLLLGIFVAGKNAAAQQAKLEQFLQALWKQQNCTGSLDVISPFEFLKNNSRDAIVELLRAAKVGQYSRIASALREVSDLVDVHNVTRRQLITIPGIGMKTASFFLLYGRGEKVAVLDTHILQHMQELRWTRKAKLPASVTGYLQLERVFLAKARQLGLAPEDLDFRIWSYRSGHA